MKKTIEDLQRMLICEHMIVTGSYALFQYGLVKESDIKDLDIILVKPTEGTLELVKNLMINHPAKTHPPKEDVLKIEEKVDFIPPMPFVKANKPVVEFDDDDDDDEEIPPMCKEKKEAFAKGGLVTSPTLSPTNSKFKDAKVAQANKLGLIAIFTWNGHKVDIFVQKEEPYVTINEIKYAMIPNIVRAKKSCNRVKDWIQLRTISKFFFNKDEWERFLDTNPKISNSQEDYPF
jgi:hypothetical protein